MALRRSMPKGLRGHMGLRYDLRIMSDPLPLTLVAFTSKIDEPWVPPLQQVVIFTKILGYICDLEPQRLPKESFDPRPCPTPDSEDLDEGVKSKGIDFLGLYEPNKVTVTLNICRIVKLCARHGFQREDVIKIVLIHELAHFVTHLGTTECKAHWEDFCKAESEAEEFAQEATHLLLRAAGYGYLVHVFESLSPLCPPQYNKWQDKWRETWKPLMNNLGEVLQDFQKRLPVRQIPERENMTSGPQTYEE
jgi:hypothetical protein